MSSVSDILNNIAALSLNEDTLDAEMQARFLRYLNRAYKDVYVSIAENYPQALLESETVTVTSGTGTLTAAPLTIKSVRDTTNSNWLDASDELTLEQIDPDLDDTGNPLAYYWDGATTLKVHPLATISARAKVLPQPATLASDTTEASIKIPPVYHAILDWKTIEYIAYDERDKGFSIEQAVIERNIVKWEGRLKAWLDKLPKEKTYVQGVWF